MTRASSVPASPPDGPPRAETPWARARRAIRAHRSALVPIALALITVLVFSPALRNGFVHWDDSVNLFENARYRGLGWPQIRWMFTTTLMGHYIPVAWLTFGLDYTLWGMDPFGYHLTNVLLHAANAALVYAIARRLIAKATALDTRSLGIAAGAAALFFALNPLRAESVAWATERRDVLSGLFFLLTVLAYLAAVDADRPRRRRLLVTSAGCFLLALLSKSIVMTLPLVLLVLDVYPLKRLHLGWTTWRDRSARAVVIEKLPHLALALAGAATSYWAVASNNFLTSVARYGLPARIAMTGYSLWFYVAKTFVPLGLSPLHELPASVSLLEPRFLSSTAAVVIASAALLFARRRWPAGLASWASYVIVLGPVTGIVHAGFQLTHDRYSYLSCLGWALLVGGGVGAIAHAARKRALRPVFAGGLGVAAALWITALGTLTWYQVQIWRDSETLWRYAVETDPTCSVCQSALGSALSRRKLFSLAKERYELALALRPDRIEINSELGLTLQTLGESQAAIDRLTLATTSRPNDPRVLANLGGALLAEKRPAEAVAVLERANRIDPSYVPGLINLGITLVELGEPQKGLGHLLRARELRPDEPVVRFDLVRAYVALRDRAAAWREFDALVALDLDAARALVPTLSALR